MLTPSHRIADCDGIFATTSSFRGNAGRRLAHSLWASGDSGCYRRIGRILPTGRNNHFLRHGGAPEFSTGSGCA